MDNQIMITSLTIEKVRHISDIIIPICPELNGDIKHLLITGKNGSGKTSVLNALAGWLENVCQSRDFYENHEFYFSCYQRLQDNRKLLRKQIEQKVLPDVIHETKERIKQLQKKLPQDKGGIFTEFSCDPRSLYRDYLKGKFILAYFRDNRVFDTVVSKHVEKVSLKNQYSIKDEPRKDFVKYLVDKKVSQSLYQTKNDTKMAQKLQTWFDSFEELLREIFDDTDLTLDFDVETFRFYIKQPKRARFDFNTMSAGYAAILDIAVGIIMRMEAHTGGTFQFDMPGIVLIDELETHLHYELQRKVLPFLCRVFPNIQFIVTTHSAFILNSIENAVIYDLENRTLVTDGLSDIPYDGIIKGYFGAPTLSEELRKKFERYKELVQKPGLSDEELTEISRLQLYLDEIPDYLALDLTTEYQRLKLEFESREDL